MRLGRAHTFTSPATTNQQDHSNVAVLPTDNLTVCDVIDSLAVNGSEATGVTTFVQESCEKVEVLPLVSSINIMPGKSALTQNLLEYFSRPRHVSQGLIPTTRSNILTSSPTSQVVVATWFPQAFDRLIGAVGWRFTVVYHLQITATPFHQGLLSMCVQYATVSGGTAPLASRPETSTNLHHTRIDIAESTMTQLEVPFMMDVEWVPTTSTYGTTTMNTAMHTFGLNTLTPSTLPTGLSQARYNLYVSLKDIQLFGAGNPSVSNVTVQAGKVVSAKNVEFESDAYPMSSGFHAASRAIRFFTKAVPLLSSIGATPVWALEKAAGVARYFGYAKPTVQDPVTKMNFLYSAAEQNVDQPFVGLVVGPFASQDFGIGAKFAGTDVDEMSLQYVTSRWSQINILEIRTTDSPNRVCYLTENEPSAFWFRAPVYSATAANSNTGAPNSTTTIATANSFQPSSLFFAANFFNYWRGAVRYRFTFVKTKMHAGRVLASYQPEISSPSQPPDFQAPSGSVVVGPEISGGLVQPFGYSAIFDLKDGNVFEFEVPFIANRAWMDWGRPTGNITLTIVDPLIASATVSTSIYVMVEVCGAPDFELAVPVTSRYPVNERGTITLQSSRELSTLVASADQYTIGHSITSLKQLIMLPHSQPISSVAANTDWVLTVLPWFFRPTPPITVPAPTTYPTGSFTFGGIIASAYAFVRGGTDVHVYASNIANLQIIGWQTSAFGNIDASLTLATAPPVSATPRVWSNPDAPIHYRYPLFANVARLCSNLFNGIVWNPSGAVTLRNPLMNGLTLMETPSTWNRLAFQNRQSGQSQPIYFNRSASEDAACAVYQGPVPFGLLTAGATTQYDVDSTTWNYNNAAPVAVPAAALEPSPVAAASLSAFSSAQESAIRNIKLAEAFPDGGITTIVNREVSSMAPPPSPSIARSLARTSSKSSILQSHTL